MLRYSISIKWSDEDRGFIATAPELPGLSAFGSNQAEALSELSVAAVAYLNSLKKSRKPIPAIEKVVSFSGQLRVRMPRGLHANLSESAKNEGVSLNTYIVTILSKRNIEEIIFAKLTKMEKTAGFVTGVHSQNI